MLQKFIFLIIGIKSLFKYPDDIDKQKEYRQDDFHQLGLKFTNDIIIADDLKEVLKKNDIFKETSYIRQKEYYNSIINEFTPILDKGFENMKDKLYAKWINDKVQFGLFSSEFIERGTILGIWSGLIHSNENNFDYTWLLSHSFDLNIDIFIDNENQGNMMRFINDNGHYNCEAIGMPYKNIWTIIVIATSDLYPGDEISYDYGSDYWLDSNKIHYKGISYDQLISNDKDNVLEQNKKIVDYNNKVKNALQANEYFIKKNDKIYAKQFIKKNSILSQNQQIHKDKGVQQLENFLDMMLFINLGDNNNQFRYSFDDKIPNIIAHLLPNKNKWIIQFQSLNDLNQGQEIIFDIGDVYFDSKKLFIIENQIENQ